MEELVKQREENTKLAESLEQGIEENSQKCTENDKKISENERQISTLEASLDDQMTWTVSAHEKLEEADKTAADAELAVSALVRRVQLLEEESNRVNERLAECMDKLPQIEKNLNDNERIRKCLEATSFQNEERFEIQEIQLQEATQIAEESGRKFEEVTRKLKMVENDLERVNDRAEEFEKKIKDTQEILQTSYVKLKELEGLSSVNGEKEDHFEEEVKVKSFDLNNQDQRAEFAERTVDKLEATIDNLTEQQCCRVL